MGVGGFNKFSIIILLHAYFAISEYSIWQWTVFTFHHELKLDLIIDVSIVTSQTEYWCWVWKVVCAMVIAKSKKVKPNMNNTMKNMDYNWTSGQEPPNNQEVGFPRALFIPHSNSLPFEERRVTLEQPIKVNIVY